MSSGSGGILGGGSDCWRYSVHQGLMGLHTPPLKTDFFVWWFQCSSMFNHIFRKCWVQICLNQTTMRNRLYTDFFLIFCWPVINSQATSSKAVLRPNPAKTMNNFSPWALFFSLMSSWEFKEITCDPCANHWAIRKLSSPSKPVSLIGCPTSSAKFLTMQKASANSKSNPKSPGSFTWDFLGSWDPLTKKVDAEGNKTIKSHCAESHIIMNHMNTY